jgi:bifunctional DNase/RNase
MSTFIPVEIISITTSFSTRNGYSLTMRELGGTRKIQIIVGMAEAQSIAIALENIPTSRPLSHHFFSSILNEFDIELQKVQIHDFSEGVYYANAFFKDHYDKTTVIDCRPSDAICMALRHKKQVLIHEDLFESYSESDSNKSRCETVNKEADYEDLDIPTLQKALSNAIENEDYELAAEIKKIIDDRLS